MTREVRLPAIPVPRPENVVEVLRAIKTWLDSSGNTGDRLLRASDIQGILAQVPTLVVPGEPGTGGGGGTTDPDTPPDPTNLRAAGAFAGVILTWDHVPYSKLSYFEVWRASTNTLGDAVLLATTFAPIWYDDTAPFNTNWFYWVRARSTAGLFSQYNATAGTPGAVDTALPPLIVEAENLATGAVTASKLLSTGKGAALNADPWCLDASAWLSGSGGTITMLTGLTDAPSGSTGIANAASVRGVPISLEFLPVDQGVSYLAEAYAKQLAGAGGACYLGVAWYNASKQLLPANQPQPTGAGSPTGWSNGTYSYYGLAGQTPPGTWTRYTAAFGPGQTRAIPSNARFMRVVALLNLTDTAGAQHAVTGLKISQMASADFIVDGAIGANKLAANAIVAGTAAIGVGAISRLMVAEAAIDDARIAELNAAKLTAGDGTIGGNLKSSNYVPGVSGWILQPSGFTELRDVVARGTVFASAGAIGGNLLGENFIQSETWNLGYGWQLRSDGVLKVVGAAGDRLIDFEATGDQPIISVVNALTVLANGNATFNGNGTFSGALNAATGTFDGALGAGVFSPSNLDSIREERDEPGTYEITVPALKPGWSQMNMRVTMIGGGGGGGGGYYSWAPNADPAAGGGGGGAGTLVVDEIEDVTPGQTLTIVVGSAGAGGARSTNWSGSAGASTPGQNGTSGTASSYTLDIYTSSAPGGVGGTGGSATYAYNGGGYVVTDNSTGISWVTAYPVANVPGGSLDGQPGSSLRGDNNQIHAAGGRGGNSFYGPGGAGGSPAFQFNPSYASQVPPATAYGAGGGGGSSSESAGKAGRGGYVLVEFYDPFMVITNNRYQQLITWLDSRGMGTVPPAAR